MKKILVPTDFSSGSMDAIHYAIEIALTQNADIILFHSIIPVYSGDTSTYAINFMEEYYDYKKKELDKLVEKIYRTNPAYRKIKIKAVSNLGFTAENIILTAKSNKVDLIVMGTKGATGFKGLMIGSTAGGVVSRSTIPVLVIPAKAKYHKLKSPFVFATDFTTQPSKGSKKILENFCSLTSHCTVKLVHVVESKKELSDEKAITQWTKALQGISVQAETIIHPDINEAVNKYSKKTKAGMTIMVSHHYNILERMIFRSITKHAAYNVKLPLLVLVK